MKSWKPHSIRSILSLSLREKAGHMRAFTFLWFGACAKFQHKRRRSVCVRFQVLSLPQTQPCACLSGKADLWRSDFLSYDATVTICRRLVSCWESDFWAQYQLEQKGNARSFGEVGKFTGKGCRLVNNVESYYFVSGHNTSTSTETRRASPVCGGGREKGCYLIT